MAIARWRQSNKRDEEGAILITAAILLTAVSAFAGLTLAGGSVYAAAQEGRKAADLAALGAAANLPTLNLGTTPNPLGLPAPSQVGTPLGTVDLTSNLPTLADDFTYGACAIAARQFAPGSAPLTESYGTAAPTCTPEVGLANQWLQELADCLGGPAAASGCAAALESGIASLLPPPAPTSPAVSALQAATHEAGMAGQVVTTDLMVRIRSLNTTLFGRLDPLLNQLNEAGGVSVDMRRLAPALLTPQIKVTITQEVDVPGGGLVGAGPVTLRTSATARRAIKNAVVVPAVTFPNSNGVMVFDANPALSTAKDEAFAAVEEMGALVTPAADQALTQVACPGTSATCPVVSDSFDAALADLHDAIDPPNGTAPTTNELIDHAVQSGEPVMLAAASFALDPQQVLGSTVYGLPGVAQLLPGLLFVPALEMVPAVLSVGPLGRIIATPVDTAVAAAQTKGLYRARLVD